MTVYNTSEIFVDIPDDPEHVLINIPDEICKELGWTENDTILVKVDNGDLILEKTNGE